MQFTFRGVIRGDAQWGEKLGPHYLSVPENCGDSLAEGSLVWAASRGLDLEARHILQYGLHSGPLPGVNVQDNTGRTAASYFAGNGCLELLEALLDVPDLDINLPDNEGNTPLHFAAQAGQVEVVSLLVTKAHELEVDYRNNLGFTPLMKAAIQGRTKCAKILLFAGASPTVRDYGRGLRAEEWARFCGRYGCSEMIERHSRSKLMEKGASSGRWGSDPSLGPQVIGGMLIPPPSAPPTSSGGGLASKLKRVLRPKTQSYNLVTHITTAAFCASSPAFPAQAKVPPVVKSLIRPLTVPKLQVTSPNEVHSYSELKPKK
ncbi:hypothetical protein GE061_004842 [Apolygus lucorum]|uniref:Ankyrin repeat domain-containing protein 33B n=1 Tax=Apolygus lucorum TaxID=248454 RepID=A0A8S9X0H8_APOLU|nr:hypothetical protein GE061_004842 [Apolygus lucorum]